MYASSPSVDRQMKTPRGEVRIRFPGGPILHSWASGHVDLSLGTFIRDAGNDVVARAGRLTSFHEWDQAETYDPDVRKLLTDWGVELGAKVDKVHVLFRSRLVAMGVTVASVVLGRMMVAYQDPEKFKRVLRDTLAQTATRGAGA